MSQIELISALREIVNRFPPLARVYLYGSQARGEANGESDVDLLILLDKEEITPKEEAALTDPLYDFEFQHGIIMSPIVMTQKKWDSLKSRSSFYHFVDSERIRL